MVLDGPSRDPIRLADLKSLQLPESVHNSVEQIIHDNRMYWEPWIESASNYKELRQNLQKRGYSGLYPSSKPLFDGSSLMFPHKINASKHPQRKAMVKKKT